MTPISIKWTVAHGVLDKFKLFNNIRKLLEKRQLRSVFRRQIRATGQLRTVFWTSFRLLTKDAKFKQTVSRGECLNQKFQSTGQLHTMFWTSFSFLTKVANFKRNESCAECFDANFNQQDSCAGCFKQGLAI